jgi:hypothetical protein
MTNRQENGYSDIAQLEIDIAVLRESIRGFKELIDAKFSLMDKALVLQRDLYAKHFEEVNNFNKRIKDVSDEKLSVLEYKDKHKTLEDAIKVLVSFRDTFSPLQGLQAEDAKRIHNIESFQNKLLGLAIVLPFIMAIGVVLLEYLLKH